MTETTTRRLFIALWPDEEQRRQLRQCIHELAQPRDARAVKRDNWHITLKYIGPCNQAQQTCVEQLLEQLSIPAFEPLSLDHSGYWARPRVAWLGCQETPQALREFVAQLEAALERDCDIAAEQRSYVPHLTIFRKLKSYPHESLSTVLTLAFDGIALVESLSTPDGVHYQVLKHYPVSSR